MLYRKKIKEAGLPIVGNATIREIVRIVNNIENQTGDKFIRMEMGVPGINPPEIAINAEIDALKKDLLLNTQ
jgi:hypothetical protein